MHRLSPTVVVMFSLALACGKKEEAEDPNTAPIAEAGPSQSLSANAVVVLSGSGSYDPDGDRLTYHWSFDTVPDNSGLLDLEQAFTLNDEREAGTTFSPDAPGTYVVSLTVTDSFDTSSDPDRTLINVAEGDAPVADAGPDQNGEVGGSITVDGSESYDAVGRDLNYDWSFAKVPEHSALTALDGATSASATFVPDTSGLYIVALLVDNGLTSSEPDATIIRVLGEATDAPVADAGGDQTGHSCSEIAVDGTGSSDPNDEPLTFLWDIQTLPAGSITSTDSFGDRTAEETSFQPDLPGEYVLSLSVHDGFSWSTPDTMALTVTDRPWNSPPVVSPGVPSIIEGGDAVCEVAGATTICAYCDPSTITLGDDAIITDPDRDWTVATWSVVDGSAELDDPSELVTEVLLTGARPDAIDACAFTEYEFVLSVTDCVGEATSASVVHMVNCCGYDPSAIDEEGDTGTVPEGEEDDPVDEEDVGPILF